MEIAYQGGVVKVSHWQIFCQVQDNFITFMTILLISSWRTTCHSIDKSRWYLRESLQALKKQYQGGYNGNRSLYLKWQNWLNCYGLAVCWQFKWFKIRVRLSLRFYMKSLCWNCEGTDTKAYGGKSAGSSDTITFARKQSIMCVRSLLVEFSVRRTTLRCQPGFSWELYLVLLYNKALSSVLFCGIPFKLNKLGFLYNMSCYYWNLEQRAGTSSPCRRQ